MGLTEPPVTENPFDDPSIRKVRLGDKGFPDLSTMPLPLLEVRFPDRSRKSPAEGLEVIGLKVMEVGDLIIMVLINVNEECRVSVPFEPLNISMTDIVPRGCE